MLLRLDISNNQLRTLPASFYFNGLCKRTAIDGKGNPWLVVKELKDLQEQFINPLSDEQLKELSDELHHQQGIFFSTIWELSGSCYSVPFQWEGPTWPAGDISSIVAKLRGRPIYTY